MDRDALQRYFFIGLLLIVSLVIFFIFLPFLEVIVLSVILAISLGPIYSKILKKLGGREGLSALLVIFLFAVIIIVPASFLATKLLNESKDLYTQLTDGTQIDYIQKITSLTEETIQKIIPGFRVNIGEYISLGATFITNHLSSIVSGVLGVGTGIVLIFFSVYFLLKDGKKFKHILISLSPLSDEYDQQIFLKIKQTIHSTVRGVLLIALVQGLLAGIGMWIFGVPNPTLWGTVSAVASLVPGLGTAIIFIPAVAYMMIIGNSAFALGLLLWGVLIVGLVDNFLTPYLYSRGIEIHQLIMLFAVLGGLVVFGPIGFIFGPIILALFFSLIDIYQNLILKKKSL